MKKDLWNARQGDPGHQPTDLTLIEDPIEFIAEDHLRIRAVCETVDHIATAEDLVREDLSETINFLSCELPLLLHDENEDLYTMLRLRCEEDDEIEKTLERLKNEHDQASEAIPGLVEMLKNALDGDGQFDADERALLSRFAADLRKHVIVENAIILPLARVRLTDDDRTELRNRMIARRTKDGRS